jgi:hypothetical protein
MNWIRQMDKMAEEHGMPQPTIKTAPKSEIMERAKQWQAEQETENIRYEEMAEVETLRHIAELCPVYETEF